MLVICDPQSDYDRSFRELEIPAEFATHDQLLDFPFAPASFNVVAAPMGLFGASHRAERTEWIKRGEMLQRWIRPGGALLIGFSNRWDPRRKVQSVPTSTVWEIARMFGNLGFHAIQFYGAIPEPLAPEYIIPLHAQALGFVLNHRYRHKLPRPFLALAGTPAANWLLGFLPFYYVVAQQPGRAV